MKNVLIILSFIFPLISCSDNEKKIQLFEESIEKPIFLSEIDKNDIYIACDSNTYVLDRGSKRFYRFRKNKKNIIHPIFVQDRANNKSKEISEQEFNLISFTSPNEIYYSFIHKKIDSTKKIHIVEQNDFSYYLHEVQFLQIPPPPPPPYLVRDKEKIEIPPPPVWKRMNEEQ